MLEVYFDKRGEIAIENMSALLKAFPEYAERATASALKSEGYRLRGLIQAAIRGGGVDGEWNKLNPHTGIMAQAKKRYIKNYRMVWKGKKGSKRRVREYKDVIKSAKSKPLLKLASAVRYQYDKDIQTMNIGFVQSAGTSESMLRLARTHANGYTTRITPKMRKYLFAIGFPVKKSTSILKTPPRPVIDPIFQQEESNIIRNLEIKFLKSIRRYLEI